jgi:transcription elongation GreA/GreB family factor
MSLRDQFKKANILSDKEARRLAHEARVERTEKGREGLEQDAAQRQRELDQLQSRERERVRRETERSENERRQREELVAVRVLVNDAKKPGPGTVKFYFEAGDGTLPWLEVSPREAQEVRAGSLCVVRSGPPTTHTYRLLSLEATKRVAKVWPEAVVFAPRGLIAG